VRGNRSVLIALFHKAQATKAFGPMEAGARRIVHYATKNAMESQKHVVHKAHA
jgi:hypothetical protein